MVVDGDYVGLLMWKCGGRPISQSYKAEGRQSRLAQQLTCYPPTSSTLVMSLVNSCVFERSMGHQISREDARFHMHTSDGQHYLSNQQVRSCTDLV